MISVFFRQCFRNCFSIHLLVFRQITFIGIGHGAGMVYPRCQRFFNTCCIQVRSAPRWAVCSPNFRQVAPCKEIQDTLGFWFPRHGYRILGAKFRILCQVNLDSGFQSLLGFRIFFSCIPDSKAQDSRFHKQKFPGSRNMDSLAWDDITYLASQRRLNL